MIGNNETFIDNSISEPGIYVYEIYGMNNAGQGLSAVVSAWVGMDLASDGFLYGVDINEENLYKIDPMTGERTLVGPTGIITGYGQDVSYDSKTGNLYSFTCSEETTGAKYYGYYDIETGEFNVLMNTTDQYSIFAINDAIYSGLDEVNKTSGIYPNPAKDKLVIEASNLSNIQILNVNGSVVYEHNSTGSHDVIDVSGLSNGIYFVRLVTGTKSEIHKVLINN